MSYQEKTQRVHDMKEELRRLQATEGLRVMHNGDILSFQHQQLIPDERRACKATRGNIPTCEDCGLIGSTEYIITEGEKWAVSLRANDKMLCDSCRDKYSWQKCKQCGQLKSENSDAYNHLDAIYEGLCFSCYHWQGVMESNKGQYSIRTANGRHYSCSRKHPMTEDRRNAGFGGNEFLIEFTDSGLHLRTNNMWHQGQMPPFWRKKYPPNAIFLNSSPYFDTEDDE